MFGRSNSIKSTPPMTTPRPADNGSNGNNAPSGTLGGVRVSQAQTANTPAPPGGASKPSRDWKTTPIGETTRQTLSDAVSTFQASGHRSKKTNNDDTGEANEATGPRTKTNNDKTGQANHATGPSSFGSGWAGGHRSKKTNNDNAGQANHATGPSSFGSGWAGGHRSKKTNNDNAGQANEATGPSSFGSVLGTHTDDGQPSVAGEEKVSTGWRKSFFNRSNLPTPFSGNWLPTSLIRTWPDDVLRKEYGLRGNETEADKKIVAEVVRRLDAPKKVAANNVSELLEAVKNGNKYNFTSICARVSEAIDVYREDIVKLTHDVDRDILLKELTTQCPIWNKISDSQLEMLKTALTTLKDYADELKKNAGSYPSVMALNAKSDAEAVHILEIVYETVKYQKKLAGM